MANNNVEIKVGVNVEGAGQVQTLQDSLQSTGLAATGLGDKSAQSVAGINQAKQASEGYATTSKKLRDGLESVSVQLDRAKSELLALVGVGAGVEGIKSIADLADNYKNLEARIKLVTGAGQAFDTAFAGVFDVARRTNSAVEETGVLFTKLAQAGKSLGVSQSEALRLTETINQSIQLSGASAEASKASIIQLVQGLQSGVLRGDEFNSVMEQSPRLAQALADGLGVGTGELRKMAEAGQLTSATVIKALQNQSDAVQSEFGKLPATVGRAMTNLSTAFTAYVGEADKAGGYTAKLAHAIDMLAGNLGTVASTMIHAGQTLGAMKLLGMAQNWLSASNAIKTTVTATEAATASTVKNTAARMENTSATNVNTLAQARNAAAWNDVAAKMGGVGPMMAKAGDQAGFLSRAFGTLGGAAAGLMRTFAPLLAVDFALNFKQYGTAIGEWAAQLMGAKDRSKELAEQDKRLVEQAQASADAIKKQAAAIKDASDRSFGLTKEASLLITKFDDLHTKGDTAAAAVASIGKDFDLSSIPGVKNATAVLDKLAADGKLSAAEFQKAWADALKGEDLAAFETKFNAAMLSAKFEADKAAKELKAAIARGVSGEELKAFEVKAKAALEGTARGAERLAQVNDAILRESVNRVGDTYNVLAQKSSAAATSAINDTETMIRGLDRLKAQGVDTAAALTASIGKGIDTASTQKDLDIITKQVEQVRKVLGDKVADGLLQQAKQKAEELRKKLEDLTPGIQNAREAMRQLGITSDAELKRIATSSEQAYTTLKNSGTASTRELQDAFKKYAADAIAANGGVASESLKVEAAIRGVTLAVDANGKASIDNATRIKQANEEVARSYITWGEYAEKAAERELAAREKVIAAREKEISLIEREQALENKRRGVDAHGMSADSKGNRIVMGSELKSATGIMNFLRQAGIDNEAEVKRITNKFLDADGTVTYANNRGQLEYGGDTVSMALLHAAEQYTLHGGKERVAKEAEDRAKYLAGLPGGAKAAQDFTKAATSSTTAYTVNVNLNGANQSISVASKTDADRLAAMFKTIGEHSWSAQ